MKKVNTMNYKTFIYVVITLLTAFTLTGINFNGLFKKNHSLEAKIFVGLITMAVSYLVTNFIIQFMEFSKIL